MYTIGLQTTNAFNTAFLTSLNLLVLFGKSLIYRQPDYIENNCVRARP